MLRRLCLNHRLHILCWKVTKYIYLHTLRYSSISIYCYVILTLSYSWERSLTCNVLFISLHLSDNYPKHLRLQSRHMSRTFNILKPLNCCVIETRKTVWYSYKSQKTEKEDWIKFCFLLNFLFLSILETKFRRFEN